MGSVLDAAAREHFERWGHVTVPVAFGADDAAAMRDAVWATVEARGGDRHDPGTWRADQLDHLQHLRREPAFAAVGSERTMGAIHELLADRDDLRTRPPAAVRKAVMAGHPYLDALQREGDREARITRFVDASEEVLGCELQVRELTGRAGDVILLHPLVLHTRPPHAGTRPRFLLNKDLRRPGS